VCSEREVTSPSNLKVVGALAAIIKLNKEWQVSSQNPVQCCGTHKKPFHCICKSFKLPYFNNLIKLMINIETALKENK
jgi:hypothetical protein